MNARHAFEPLASSPDMCGHVETIAPGIAIPCRLPRTSAMHDTFSSGAHPGLATLRPSARLAALLGCTVDELRDDLARLIGSVPHRLEPLATEPESFARATTVGSSTVWRCPASVDDGCQCERAPGHSGLHAHLHDLWDTHLGSLKLRLRFRRCYAVCAKPGAKLSTYRCVRELGHDGDEHQLDNGETFS